MVTIGVDSHKRTHTFVAVDEVGKKIAEKTLPATTEGHLDGLAWAERWPERRWAIEDCRHLTRRLESDMLGGGEAVVRVPTRLMASERRGDRERGKSDAIDALAVARAARASRISRSPSSTDRPDHSSSSWITGNTWCENGPACRPGCAGTSTSSSPGSSSRPGAFAGRTSSRALKELLAGVEGTLARIARELLAEIRNLTKRANDLEREITTARPRPSPSLLALRGCGPLSAAKIVGEVAGASRFKSRAAFARWNGTGPIPVWSGSTNFRLNRGGNRQVNAALHRIALTQTRGIGTGRAYVEGRIARGDSKKEAVRLLRRRLSDEVFRRLLLDEAPVMKEEHRRAA